MIAALGTLVFLTTLWLIAVVGAMVVEQSGAKIRAALKGEPGTSLARPVTVRIRYRSSPARAIRATPRLRAAA